MTDRYSRNNPMSSNHYKYKPQLRNYQTDIDRNSLKHSRQGRTQIYGNKLKLISAENARLYNQNIKKERKRLYSYQWKQPEEQEIDSIKKDVQRLQYQLALKKNKEDKQIIKYKIKHKDLNRYKTSTLPSNYISEPYKKRYLNNESLLWEVPGQLLTSPTRHKKLYKIRSKKYRQFLYQSSEQEDNLSVIDRITLKKSRLGLRDRYIQQDQKLLSKIKHPIRINKILKSTRYVRLFRKAVNVILFTIRLRTFNERMRIKRFGFFNQYVKNELSSKLLLLKKQLTVYSKQFFMTIIDQQNFSYRLHEEDEPILKKQKINSIRKLVGLQIKCLQKCVKQMYNGNRFSQLIYLLCKHGNYSCVQEINTSQQLNIMCLSQFYGYVRADKHLQQSAILQLVFIKILLYNILLQPDKIDMTLSSNINLKVIFSNVKLVGNILYQLLIDIQDQILQKSPPIYTLGNWSKLKNLFKFKIAQSMTVRQGFYQKNELISGLASHKYIGDIYKIKLMAEQKHILTELVRMIHQTIVSYHQGFRRQTFIV